MGYGPRALLLYDDAMQYVKEVAYLDLEFCSWRGGELIEDISGICVTADLWSYLSSKFIIGVSVREMSVTIGDTFRERCPGIVVPLFKELVLPRTLCATKKEKWCFDTGAIPNAEMFTGVGLPLFVTQRIKDLLCSYGVKGLRFEEAHAICP